MAVGGGKPGITAKVRVITVTPNTVELQFKDDETKYFKVNDEFVAQFLPTPPDGAMGAGS